MSSSQQPRTASLEEQLRNLILTSNAQQANTTNAGQTTANAGHVTSNHGHVTASHGHITPNVGHATANSGRVTANGGHVTRNHHPASHHNQGHPAPHNRGRPFQNQHRQNTNPQSFHNGPHPGPRAPPQFDPNAYQRGPSRGGMQYRQPRQLYQPQSQPISQINSSQYDGQWQYLDGIVSREIPLVEMSTNEISLKDLFRIRLQDICQNLKQKFPGTVLPSITLESFGSLSSGFATTGSDMDLAIVTDSDEPKEEHFSLREDHLPRVLEKELLDQGIGARLLTRTRVPIIKICETPTPELLHALREERQRWDSLPDEEKYSSSNDTAPKADVGDVLNSKDPKIDDLSTPAQAPANQPDASPRRPAKTEDEGTPLPSQIVTATQQYDPQATTVAQQHDPQATTVAQQHDQHAARQRRDKQWTRERAAGPLDFPKSGVGIQCDINFFNPLGIYNTKLLRCYSKCDARVRPMVLFVKSWAKRRKINSSYSGSLSSYGYVLMVLHYLVNVVEPPVLPNLQLQAFRVGIPPTTVDGWEVCFLSNETEIENSAARGVLTRNQQPLGELLRGFFQYFASTSGGQGFIWMQDVLSLRTPGGILKKEEKGWTGAKTEVGDNQKEVRHRYLFAIEDPFETAHNVARTVTHNGIVAIRDEFRRSWRIIQAGGRGLTPRDGNLFDELDESAERVNPQPPRVQPVHAPKPAPPPQQYSEAFPQLGGPKQSAHLQNGRPAAAVANPSSQARFPRAPNGNQQKRVQRNSSGQTSGVINGEQAMAHLKEFRRKQQEEQQQKQQGPSANVSGFTIN